MIVYKNYPLSKILYYKIGGIARYVLKIENKEDLLGALDFVKKNKIQKILPVGLGSNLLMSENFFDGAILCFSKGESSGIKLIGENLIEAFASELLDDVIKFSFENNLVGLEWAGGLPSTVGGAVRGNVGAFGGEIKDVVNTVEIVKLLDEGYSLEELTREQLEFGYRDSFIKRSKDILVVSVTFQLQKASKEELEKAKETYFAKIAYRNKNHPSGFPSCGSVFKNITKKEEVDKMLSIWEDMSELVKEKWHNKASMGYVIRRLGFAGFRIGGAEVSKKHANYIVNVDGAKFADVISIIEKIKEKFFQTFGFSPELEVEIVS
ncbi:MAG: UDP-N-acetylenolpyruvoylglucosamine reductase [Candidatus Levybacteria bacterium RIFCSPHIGHO2_02_FULL_37_13]|nr:MAG: UDP-N-acetylenolpyruvoylglucosamine reductase [Candidatus Levybacteria bacterium RIFCSPHIGHO2_02_FULL_37_13]OGH29067.1 MAG: UDP-N-acetylenolpyruvoylglucosamine reductase [Candidatus Levybacteria bacterium RIFCSPHIGHO2_12_FULL_37_9]OGH39731.1 MAG: UDP-N-acetylenolpyruvoylglucosamine reductase [Candidatus Levybacteria bacterium RIFCSPLOWO2_01_FULL_37_26]